MMELPGARRIETLDRADLIEMLTGLEPGWYRTADLAPRYAAWAKSKGREVLNNQKLGIAIQRHLSLQGRKRHLNTSEWHVTPEALAAP